MAPVPATTVIAATAPTPPNPQSPTAAFHSSPSIGSQSNPLISLPTQHKKEVVVIFVIEATARMSPLFQGLFDNYVEPILRQLRAPILIEGEDKLQKTKINPVLKYGLVTYGDDDAYSGYTVEKKYLTADYDLFLRFLRGIRFADGGMFRNAVTEGLVAAAELFEEHAMSRVGLSATHRPDLIRHCILIANSPPHTMGARYNTLEKFDGFHLSDVAEEMARENVHLSLIIPRTGLTELEDLVKKVNGNRTDIHAATEVTDPSHVVRLAGFKLPTLLKELKHENSMGFGAESGPASTPTNSSMSNSGTPQAKRIKRDNSPMQIPIPKPQLDMKTTPVTTNSTVVAPSTSATGISTAVNKPLSPEQARMMRQELQKQAKIKEDADKNTIAPSLSVPPTGAVPKVALTQTVGLSPAQNPIVPPGVPGLLPGQKLTPQQIQVLIARGFTQTQIMLLQQRNLMDQQKQEQSHIVQGIVPVNTQPMANMNVSVNPIAAGINPVAMNRPPSQIGFVPGVSPIPQQQPQQPTGAGLLNANSILTQPMISPQQQQQMMQQLIARQAQTNLVPPQGTTVARPPGPNNMAPSAPPRLPPAVWQGNIVWSIKDSGTGRQREFTCHCLAIPAIQSNKAEDFQPNLWPQKLQITQLMPANMQLLQERATQMKLPYCMIKPSDPNNQASKNYFTLLTRSLETKKIVATVPFMRPANAPASEPGPFGIVLVYINQKLIGLVFLNTSIPNLGGISANPQAQQPQQPQQPQQQQLQQLQLQQQQQPPNQQAVPMQLGTNSTGMGSVGVSPVGMNPVGVMNPIVSPVGVNPVNFTGVTPMNMKALQQSLLAQEAIRRLQGQNPAATAGQPFDPTITNFLQPNSNIPNRPDFPLNLTQQQLALYAMQLRNQQKPSG